MALVFWRDDQEYITCSLCSDDYDDVFRVNKRLFLRHLQHLLRTWRAGPGSQTLMQLESRERGRSTLRHVSIRQN